MFENVQDIKASHELNCEKPEIGISCRKSNTNGS